MDQRVKMFLLPLVVVGVGRLGAVVAPVAVGAAASAYGWGPAVAATAVGPLVALALILWKLPETTGVELEQTSAIP